MTTERLSEREQEVMRLAADTGGTNKEIGRALGLSPKTVEAYMRRASEKLGATNRTQAAVMFDRLQRNEVFLIGLSQEQADRIDVGLATRLQRACEGQAA